MPLCLFHFGIPRPSVNCTVQRAAKCFGLIHFFYKVYLGGVQGPLPLAQPRVTRACKKLYVVFTALDTFQGHTKAT